ncbi:hypothetical protein ACIOEX_10525 [Streptomyces sp. NPDC087850]|uniref:hypothetical protein n=1 Tax=Streptomyces sp. NPDC087850 TaxID=3365809 RepID=UPI0038012760
MCDSIAHALAWVLRLLLPAQGRQTAAAAVPAPAPANPWSKPWPAPSAQAARAIFHAKEALRLTPVQRERWRAAAFHEIGVDYDFPTINITPACPGRSWQAVPANPAPRPHEERWQRKTYAKGIEQGREPGRLWE